ncbi:transposase [Mycobacteroides abscessus subsp. bolletii]|nr:transposase [Mycobacteroides abscessus subsp. bolletii]
MQIRTAHFLQVKTLEDFNLNHLPSLRRDVLAHLATGTFRTVWKRCRANRI